MEVEVVDEVGTSGVEVGLRGFGVEVLLGSFFRVLLVGFTERVVACLLRFFLAGTDIVEGLFLGLGRSPNGSDIMEGLQAAALFRFVGFVAPAVAVASFL